MKRKERTSASDNVYVRGSIDDGGSKKGGGRRTIKMKPAVTLGSDGTYIENFRHGIGVPSL
jgi:hypothetical protein